MKKLLIRLFLFFIPIVVAAFLLDGVLTKGIRKSQGGNIAVWDDIVEGKINSDIIILGSSRALNHFDPSILEDTLHQSAYNLGLSGHNFKMVNCRYDVYRKYNKKPKVILLSVDLFMLEKRKDLFEYNTIAPFLKEPIIAAATKEYIGFDFADYNFPLMRYIGYKDEISAAIKYYVKGPSAVERFRKGYSPHIAEWNGEFDQQKKSGATFTSLIDRNSKQAFADFLQETKHQNIKVVLVYSPEYFESASFVTNRTEVMNLFKKFADSYGLPYLDYSNDTLCNSKKYFFNAEHLNVTGATLFSKTLAHDLRSYL